VKIVDLSRELYHRTPCYPGHPPVIHGVWKTHEDSLAESGNVHGQWRDGTASPIRAVAVFEM
jgi:kynurenine formamidase